jgi:hypothetical protein
MFQSLQRLEEHWRRGKGWGFILRTLGSGALNPKTRVAAAIITSLVASSHFILPLINQVIIRGSVICTSVTA